MHNTFAQQVSSRVTHVGTRWWRVIRRNLAAYLFLLPALILFGIFLWYPIATAFIISFQKVGLNPAAPRPWIGLGNFELVLANPLFWTAWWNSLQYSFLALTLSFPIPVGLAILMNEVRWKGFFRVALYIPAVLPPLVGLIVWRLVLHPSPAGLANSLLAWLGLPTQLWLQSPRTAMLSILLITTWAGAGPTTIWYLAALQGVPASLYDAAEIDGANLRQRLLHITLPQIRSVMLLMLVAQVIGTMQLFTEPFVLTGGGPVNATVTLSLLLYQYGFVNFNFGAASALGTLMFLFLAVFSYIYLRHTIFKEIGK